MSVWTKAPWSTNKQTGIAFPQSLAASMANKGQDEDQKIEFGQTDREWRIKTDSNSNTF